MSKTVTVLPLEKLVPHPLNPRIILREEVIADIVLQLERSKEFSEMFAPIVRAKDGYYEIGSGHHRIEAAKRAGLTAIPCWKTDISEEDFFMLLLLSNKQKELSALEEGIHAFTAVEKAGPGRGKKGGLSEYAEKVGKSQPYVFRLRAAAEVFMEAKKSIPQGIDLSVFLDKSQHLHAIHKLPQACWLVACEWLAAHDEPVPEIEERVQNALAYGQQDSVTADWKQYLPKSDCMSAVFTGTDPGNFPRLFALAVKVAAELPEDLAVEWREWLIENRGADSWDIAKVQQKRIELEGILWTREHAEVVAGDDAVSVLLADPPWQYDFAETDNRQIENQYPTATVEEICSHIHAAWMPLLAEDCVLFLWAPVPKLEEALRVLKEWGFSYKTGAVWDKEKVGMGYWFRGQHELLLVGTRGAISPPKPSLRVSSVFRERRKGHSKKPTCVYEALEHMFPDATKAELYQRKPRDGWIGYGNEVIK